MVFRKVLISLICSFTLLGNTIVEAGGQSQSSYLTCKILGLEAHEAVKFAAASMVWSDENMKGVSQVPGAERVFGCSRDLRERICRDIANSKVEEGQVEEYVKEGGYLGGMGAGGVLGGMVIGGLYGTTKKGYTTQATAKACYDELDYLTSVSDKISLNWSATYQDADQLNYPAFLILVDHARQQGLVTNEEVDRLIIFSEKIISFLSN